MVLAESLGRRVHPPVSPACHWSVSTCPWQKVYARQRSRNTQQTCCRTLATRELKMITSGTYHTTWKRYSIKEKIILGHSAWNEHLTHSHWSGFRNLLCSPERRWLMSILKDEIEVAWQRRKGYWFPRVPGFLPLLLKQVELILNKTLYTFLRNVFVSTMGGGATRLTLWSTGCWNLGPYDHNFEKNEKTRTTNAPSFQPIWNEAEEALL